MQASTAKEIIDLQLSFCAVHACRECAEYQEWRTRPAMTGMALFFNALEVEPQGLGASSPEVQLRMLMARIATPWLVQDMRAWAALACSCCAITE